MKSVTPANANLQTHEFLAVIMLSSRLLYLLHVSFLALLATCAGKSRRFEKAAACWISYYFCKNKYGTKLFPTFQHIHNQTTCIYQRKKRIKAFLFSWPFFVCRRSIKESSHFSIIHSSTSTTGTLHSLSKRKK